MHDNCRMCSHLWQLLHWVQMRIKISEVYCCMYIYIIYLCKKRLGSIALFSLRPTSTNQGDDSSTASPRVCVVPSPVNPYPMGTVASAQAAVDEMYGDMAEFVSMSSQMTSSCKRAKTANQARNTMQCHHHIKVWWHKTTWKSSA